MTVAAEFSAATVASMASTAEPAARHNPAGTAALLHTKAGNSSSGRPLTVTDAAAAAVAAMAAVEQAFTAAAVEGLAAAAEASFLSQQASEGAVSSTHSTAAADNDAAESGAEPDAGSCSTTVPSSPSSHPISTACADGAQATPIVPRVSSLIKALESKASAGQVSPRQPVSAWQGKGGAEAVEAMRQWRSPRAAVVARLEGIEV
jgi:hypothetical protein